MNLVRKLKISKSKLTDTVYFSPREQAILDFIDSKISDLSEFTDKKYPDSIFYMNKEEYMILQYVIGHNFFLIRYSKFWDILRITYNLKSDELITLLQYVLSSKYKLEVTTVDICVNDFVYSVEEIYKNRTIQNS